MATPYQSLPESPLPLSGSQTTSRRSQKRANGDQPPFQPRPISGRKKTLRDSKTSPKRDRRARALKRLGVSKADLDRNPQITPLMRMCGVRPERVIEVLSSDSNEESLAVVRMWFSITKCERPVVGLEAVALATGITPRRLWELYAGASITQARDSVGVMLADSLPAIMRVAIKDAKRAKGLASREHILKAAKILPTPKGSTTIINVPGPKPEGEDDDGGALLEPADETLMKFSKVMTPAALPAPAQEYVDLEPDEEETADGLSEPGVDAE